jgi:hypothetical protein
MYTYEPRLSAGDDPQADVTLLNGERRRRRMRASGVLSAWLNFFLRRQHLTAAIFPGLEVDMVRAAQLAGLLVLDISRRDESVR